MVKNTIKQICNDKDTTDNPNGIKKSIYIENPIFNPKKQKVISVNNFLVKIPMKDKEFDLRYFFNTPFIKSTYGMSPIVPKMVRSTTMLWPGFILPPSSLVITACESYPKVLYLSRCNQEVLSNIPMMKYIRDKNNKIVDAILYPKKKFIIYRSLNIVNICCDFVLKRDFVNVLFEIEPNQKYGSLQLLLNKLNIENDYNSEDYPALKFSYKDNNLRFCVSLYRTGSGILVGVSSDNERVVAFAILIVLIAAAIKNPELQNEFITTYITDR